MKKIKKNKKYIVLIIGIIFLGLGFVFNETKVIKILLELIGMAVIVGYYAKRKVVLLPYYLLICIGGLLALDYILVKSTDRVPVFSYVIESNENVKLYNAVGYRVWDCNGTFVIDKLYQRSYLCDDAYIEEVDSKVFISHVVENFDELENKFVKVKGKISSITGIEYVSMQSYEETDITMNGYVTFADNITLKFKFNGGNENVSNYEVYDNAILIGRVAKLYEDNNKYEIILEDAKIIKDEIYDDFEISVTSKKECDKDDQVSLLVSESTYDIYSSCMDKIVVRYSEDLVYELSFLLTSDKLEIDDILEKANNVSYDKDNNVLYEFDGFNILECNRDAKKQYIIGNSKLNLESGFCAK